jgi:mono/diheme cytochrome c family protein
MGAEASKGQDQAEAVGEIKHPNSGFKAEASGFKTLAIEYSEVDFENLEIPAGNALKGAKLFKRKCIKCHQVDPAAGNPTTLIHGYYYDNNVLGLRM